MSRHPRSRRPLSRTQNRRRNTHQKKNFSPNTSLDQIRVVIADDHPVAREGLSSILRSLEGVQVVGEAGDGKEACALYDRLSPDVLIVDLRMAVKDGVEGVTGLMSSRVAKTPNIVITTYQSGA